MTTHLMGNYSKGGDRTLCGLPLTPYTRLAHEGDPDCKECAAIDARDGAALADLATTEHVPDTLSKPIDHLAGYKPKAVSR